LKTNSRNFPVNGRLFSEEKATESSRELFELEAAINVNFFNFFVFSFVFDICPSEFAQKHAKSSNSWTPVTGYVQKNWIFEENLQHFGLGCRN
jgi:hypothetical protein